MKNYIRFKWRNINIRDLFQTTNLRKQEKKMIKMVLMEEDTTPVSHVNIVLVR